MKSKQKDQEIDLFYLKESDKKQTIKKNQKAKRMQEKKKKQKKEFEGELNKTKNKRKLEKQRDKEEQKKKNHREKRIQKKIEKNKKEREKQDKDYIEDIKFELENDVAINLARKNNEKKEKKKPINKKREKALKRIKRFFQLIFFIGVIIGIVAFAFTSPIFNITEIKVIDNNKVPEETVQSLSQVQIGQNIFNFNNQEVIDRVLENSYINQVEVKRILPTTIQISIQERQAAYAIMLLDKYVYIDNQGYILEISDESSELIVLENYTTPEVDLIPDKRLNGEDLEKIDDVNKILNSSKDSGIDKKITGINLLDESNYILYLAHDNKIIHIGDVTNLSEKIIYAAAILTEEEGVKGDVFVNGDLNQKFKPYFRENVDI